ncbi:septal ring lytic transglycosylase RlpA family protein [Anabaena sp. FACHB-1237]|uniref:septal ring lytic transglycosylase RlpA family protein n=1 Tax=Anabaena sp. FACHB-1237 TaxID=2692769 RepID=UPI001680D0ED|nr:septal ring lytic transglycosylase RlpA family protein [Anabaena sp. FACHB-1237]MBD2137558.1 septal ring lytic transglycosylase RlpA family protein [Anabaena sp. FACHB-1237]
MNQRHLWTIVAVSLGVASLPSVAKAQTVVENSSVTPETPVNNDNDVVKFGEYQSPPTITTPDSGITKIHSHIVNGRQAATLFVRDIPVLTFLGSANVDNGETKQGTIKNSETWDKLTDHTTPLAAEKSSKVATQGNMWNLDQSAKADDEDPMYKAGIVAAKINRIVDDEMDANQITVMWQGKKRPEPNDSYTIKIKDQELVKISENVRLADATKDLATDALQATNRFRRLIGNASPLTEIPNLPKRISFVMPNITPKIDALGVKASFKGMASWYGYDGSGSRTASGERYRPEGLTAAHRTLPLGTKVRVTNTRTGQSVVVRINDRGPYIRGRIIDLSAGAARVLGMIRSGVAPVKVEVLGTKN